MIPRLLKRILYWTILGCLLMGAFYALNSNLFQRMVSGSSARFGSGNVVVQTSNGNHYGFNVDVATTAKSRAQGLMNRSNLAPHEGMWFVFTPPSPVIFWMKDTEIPLDILFIDAAHTITHIIEHTTPFSTKSLSSEGNVAYVLEINAGMVQKLHITVGDKVIDNIR